MRRFLVIVCLVKLSLDQLNHLERSEFVAVAGPVFEHSPWIAEKAWAARPFSTIEELHQAMKEIVAAASLPEQLALIQAHPDLVGRVVLTQESKSEQAVAGLTGLSSAEVTNFDRYNQAYREKFGFPLVICARLNKKEAILAAFPIRLENEKEQEIRTALEEIYKIADFRLHDLIQP